MTNLSDIINVLPRMKSGDDLITALEVLPGYNPEIRNGDVSVRLMALSDLYRVYIPSQMSLEIYSKLYLAFLRSMQKKGTKLAVQQQNQNYRAIMQQEYSGIMGGSDSFTIIGKSGIGKSSAISRAINLITENKVIEADNPYTHVVPCVIVQCPFDSSVKGLLLEVLRKVDEVLDTKYYQNALRARATTDMLIGSVSQVALNHIGMLVVDEIQNVANSKNGKSLIGSLTQLINNSGISICMVGTPESTRFFESAMQLARRSVGLQYTTMSYDKYFQEFCKVMFRYQYVKQRTEITEGIIEWLYEHSAGITSVVVALVHDAQEIAILSGKEILNLESLNAAYQQRLSFLHGYIQPSISQGKQTSKIKRKAPVPTAMVTENETSDGRISIADLFAKAKNESIDIVQLLKSNMSVVEVAV
ncbi:TniB family NTP-binding protein [Sporomusa acidovorans]|uniref:Transposon Tn7 transposition protein TnsC n=1 Tax=Sporomusa acidovorans (strain ATCC 49682 / DSM 3132 / Mol) TaxID=1123286 RepID=A0ABZ3IZW4_SPOA4|nr:TniB family NTP-binding protein [Sporomusa acidovorans]OZC19185.1 transposon Tn7 transposition protein TnsC [Sporomusa acidovorans DSM 3132]SDF11432.1 AAA domain-containing protein [Sporomusa acidovorans]